MNNKNKFTGYDSVFASRLRKIMEDKGTTQAVLAKEAGLTRQSISQYMDGSVLPNVEKLAVMCEYFKISSDYLLGLTDSTSTDQIDQQVHDKIGLSSKAVENLEKLQREYRSALIPHTPSKIHFIDYMLSDKSFIESFPGGLQSYFERRLEDEEHELHFGRPNEDKELEETFIAFNRVIWLMQNLTDSCYDYYYKPKPRPGRKRKPIKSHNNNADN